MKIKEMPYRIEEGAIERAKYRTKMAVREIANPTEHHLRTTQWRWVSAVAVAMVVVGVVGLVKFHYEKRYLSPMEELIAEMQTAPDDVIYDLSLEDGYYLEEENQL